VAYSPASLLNPVNDQHGAPEIGAPFLYVVRHCENQDDKDKKIRGLRNLPLDDDGERQAGELDEFFRERPVATVITDDLSRTRQTAMAIAKSVGAEVETDLNLRSWDLGVLEGKSMDARKVEIQDLKTHTDKFPIGGESWGSFERKCTDCAERIVRRALEMNGPIVVVTHGSWIQVFWTLYGDSEGDTAYDNTPLKPSGVAALYLTRSGTKLKTLRGAKVERDD